MTSLLLEFRNKFPPQISLAIDISDIKLGIYRQGTFCKQAITSVSRGREKETRQVQRGNCERLIFNYHLRACRAGRRVLSRRSVTWDLEISLWKQNIIPQLLQCFASATFFEL